MIARAFLLVAVCAAPAFAESAAGEPVDNLIPPAERVPVEGTAAPPDAPDAPPDGPPGGREERFGAPPPLGLTDVVGPILKTFLMLGIVLAIAYLSLHKGLAKLVEKQTAGRRVKVVERVGLDQKRSLYIVEVDGQQMLLGGSDQGLAHLKDLGAAKPASAAPPASGFAARFADALGRSRDGKGPATASVPRAADPAASAVEGVKS